MAHAVEVNRGLVMGLISAVGLVRHPRRACPQVLKTIVNWASARRIEVFGLAGEVGAGNRGGGADVMAEDIGNDLMIALPGPELADRVDVLISLGGDGTMLRTMRIAFGNLTPILGVNLGRLGFLAEVDVPELHEALCAIDAEQFTVETRSGLRASIEDRGAIAFNDIVLIRVPGHGMAAVALHVEGHPFVRYAADAVVVATPTGSTAYSFSAGGPIVSPQAEGLLITPVAPHSAFNRALFLSTGEKLAIEILPNSGDVAVEADGRFSGRLRSGALVGVDVVSPAARVIRLGRTTFYQRTQRKFRLTGSLETE